MKVLVLLFNIGSASAAAMEASSAAAMMVAQRQAEDMRASWLDYKSMEHELEGQYPTQEQSAQGGHLQMLKDQRSSTSVMQAVYHGLDQLARGSDAGDDGDHDALAGQRAGSALIQIGANTIVDMQVNAKAVDQLLKASTTAEATATETASSWNSAFISARLPTLREAISEAEDAFRHLTGQREPIHRATEVEEMFIAAGKSAGKASGYLSLLDVKNTLPKADKDGITEEMRDYVADLTFTGLDTNKDGKISWAEADDFVREEKQKESRTHASSLIQQATQGGISSEKLQLNMMSMVEGINFLDSAIEMTNPPSVDPNNVLSMEVSSAGKLSWLSDPDIGATQNVQEGAENAGQERPISMEALLELNEGQRTVSDERLQELEMNREMERNQELALEMKERDTLAMMELSLKLELEEDKKEKAREQRWSARISKEKSSLLEKERSVKTQQKLVEKLDREQSWQEKKALKKAAQEKRDMEALLCQDEKSPVSATILTSKKEGHANCVEGALRKDRECAKVQLLESTVVEECHETSSQWQRQCLAMRAETLKDCMPMGVNWAALKRGQRGGKVDNAALAHLGEWCNLFKVLQTADSSKDKSPFMLVLSDKAAVSSSLMSAVEDFADNYKSAPWDLVQLDAHGAKDSKSALVLPGYKNFHLLQQTSEHEGELSGMHSVLLNRKTSRTLLKYMEENQARPLSEIFQAINSDKGVDYNAVAMSTGLAAELDLKLLQKFSNEDFRKNSGLCSVTSPAAFTQ